MKNEELGMKNLFNEEFLNLKQINSMKKTYIKPTALLAETEMLMETLPVSVTEVEDGYGKEREDSPADSEQTEQKDAWNGGLW